MIINGHIYDEWKSSVPLNSFDIRQLETCSESLLQHLYTFDDGFKFLYENASDQFLEKKLRFAFFVCPDFHSENPNVVDINNKLKTTRNNTFLTKTEIRDLIALGHHCGSHSIGHINCDVPVNSENVFSIKSNIEDSVSMLEDMTSSRVSSFAFPFGVCNISMLEILVTEIESIDNWFLSDNSQKYGFA